MKKSHPDWAKSSIQIRSSYTFVYYFRILCRTESVLIFRFQIFKSNLVTTLILIQPVSWWVCQLKTRAEKAQRVIWDFKTFQYVFLAQLSEARTFLTLKKSILNLRRDLPKLIIYCLLENKTWFNSQDFFGTKQENPRTEQRQKYL